MNQQTTPAARDAASLPGRTAPAYTASGDGREEPVTGAETTKSGARARRARDVLSRADLVVPLLAALLGSVILGFVAIGSQMLSMQRQIGALRNEMHQEIGALRTEMHKEIGGLREEMRVEMGELSDRITRIETFLQIHHGPLPGP